MHETHRVFALLDYWFFTSSTSGDLFLSQTKFKTSYDNMEFVSSRVTEPFHFRLARNCYAYTHTAPIGIERKHFIAGHLEMCCVHMVFLAFLGLADNLWYEQWWGVVGIPENTQHIFFFVVVSIFLLNSLKSQTILIWAQTETINTIVHDFWKILFPGNVTAIICRKFDSFRMSFLSGHSGKQKLNL